MDEYGGIPVSEDEFGGVLVDEESPSPSVIRDVPRGTLEPTDLFPGIRKMGGEIVPGQLGDTHQDIIKREGIKAEDLDQRVFVTPWGDVIDREGAANAVFPKVIPQFEQGRLHSTDLNLPQFESPISIGEEGPIFQSELNIEKKWLGLDQPPKEVSSLEPVSPPSSIPGFMVPEVSPEEKYGAIRQAPKKDIRKMVETGEGLPMMDEESRKRDWLKSQFNQQDKTDEEFLVEHPNLKFAMYGFMSPTDIPMGRISENDAKNLGFGPMSGVVSGAQNSVADFVDFMTSAPGVMTALTGGVAGGAIGAGQAGVGSAIHRGVAYAFAADMARQAPDQFASIIDAIERGDSQAATRGILNASLSLAVMKHGAQLGVTPEGIVPKGLFEKPQVQGPKTQAEMAFGMRPGAQGLATGGALRVGKDRGTPTSIGISEEAPPTDIPGEAPLAAPTEGKATVGEVVQAAPTEPAITTDKTVLPEKQVELRTPTDIAKELGIEAQESVGNFDRYLFKHKKNAEQLSVPKGSGPEAVKAQMEKALARWITPDEILKASEEEIKSIPQSAELSDRIASEMTEEQLKASEPIIVDYLKKQAEDRKLLDEGKIGVEEYAQRVMAPRTKGKLLVDVFAGLNRPLPEVPVEAKAPTIPSPESVIHKWTIGKSDGKWAVFRDGKQFGDVFSATDNGKEMAQFVADAATRGEIESINNARYFIETRAKEKADIHKNEIEKSKAPPPDGYVLEGDRYVYRGTKTPTKTPDMGLPTTVETAASLRAKADEAERIAYKASASLESAERTKQPKSVLDPLYAEVSRTEKEAIKAEELADEAERKVSVAAPTPEPIRAGPGAAVPSKDRVWVWDRNTYTLKEATVKGVETSELDQYKTTKVDTDQGTYLASDVFSEKPTIKETRDDFGVIKYAEGTAFDAPSWKKRRPIELPSEPHGPVKEKAKPTRKQISELGRTLYNQHIKDTLGRPQMGLAGFIKLAERQLTEPIRSGPGAAPPAVAEPINLEMELGAGVSLKGVSDAVKASVEYLKSLRNEELKAPKMTDRRRAILNWSAKLQRSYGEAFSKQKDIIKAVPNQTRREGITNWIQANGDRTVLQDRYNATTDPKLKAGYKAALELTPAEIAVANSVKADYANFAARGQAAGVLGDLKDNYVTQTWNLKKGPGGTGTGRTLKEKFRFSKARTFESFFEGEQLGYTPKTKDIAKLLPMYSHEMNSVIAAREMVAEMGNGVASDGRPLLAPKGVGIPVDAAEGGKATLVIPKAGKADTSDYKVLPNQPALSGWKWVAKDDAGNPVFLKADLAVHPEAVAYLKNVLGRSAIRDWYGTRTTALSELPKIIVKGIDMANSETKRTMLGMLATFHQIQTGTHAVGHRVNPFFSIPKIDLVNNRVQMDAAQHGLMMLPDRASMDQFMEGFRTSGLISKIPGIGPIADYYSHYLFHEYIPGLKFKTYEAILSRNQKVYAKDLAAGRVTPSDIKILSAEQANAAYGHLNYADLGRNPTVQHIAQVGLLAPDFLEARGRFAGQAIKGIAGAKVGREQLLALATLAIAQTAAAYVSAKLSGGDWDNKRPFEFVLGNRRYTVRSVPEDLVNLVTKTRQFIHSRLSPLVGKGLLQYLTGVDYRGQKVKASQTTKELAAQPLPLTIRGFTGLGNNTLSGMEQLAGSLGLRISRYSPSLDVYDMVKEFKKSSDDPKLQADIELQEKEVFSSVYDKLRTALRAGDLDAARKEYDAIKAIRTPKQIDNAMKPWTGGNLDVRTFQISPRKPKPFTGSAKTEKLFLQGLNPEQRTMYNKAVQERLEFYNTFKQMLAQPGSKETDEFGGIPVE